MEVPISDRLRDETASRLPSYRHTDLCSVKAYPPQPLDHACSTSQDQNRNLFTPSSTAAQKNPHGDSPRIMLRQSNFPLDVNAPAVPSSPSPSPSPCLSPSPSPSPSPSLSLSPPGSAAADNFTDARRGRDGLTAQRGVLSAEPNPTTNWVTQQQMQSMMIAPEGEGQGQGQGQTQSQCQAQGPRQHREYNNHEGEPARRRLSRSMTDPAARPLIRPIRGFKLSSQRKSPDRAEMVSPRTFHPDSDDANAKTLRALEGGGRDNAHRMSAQLEQQDEHHSDESDLFLRAAREEERYSRSNLGTNEASPHQTNSPRSRHPPGSATAFQQDTKSRFGQRASLPTSSTSPFPTSITRRRGSDQESAVSGTRPMEDQESIAQALTYRPAGRDRPGALEDNYRNRYNLVSSRSTPSTPRGSGARELSPDQTPYGGRRPSTLETNLPPRSYRQSNLSHPSRTYNSSPLAPRTSDMHEVSETPRAVEGTESTVSTTAPSTVWDELEELKSRIHRLELTGKLPPTSGAAMSRPPTATTTVTTISSSPKQRGRDNSFSPVEPAGQMAPHEVHPLLQAALAKSKPLVSSDIYKALEASAADALAITTMMGTSGQPGPISSSQSTLGGNPSVSDRQVRRKADSMCRSLTELCLALSEGKKEPAPPVISTPVERSAGHETEVRASIEPINTQLSLVTTNLTRAISNPRGLSRLEARRSSLLATSTLPSPRYTPSEAGSSTQSLMAGRRTSLLLRPRRAATEEPADADDARFRTSPIASSEIGRIGISPRGYAPQKPLPERTPTMAAQSSLPVRRSYQSPGLTNTVPAPRPPISMLSNRKFLDRTTPERDTASVVGLAAEDRGQRRPSVGYGNPQPGRTGSLTRRTNQPNAAELSPGHPGGLQSSH
ncbi:hypothetical protein B2J93_2238 [Marssonina coronariae]|uniref:LPXTG-motif cell wall anchor domain protein n=1 Tax=Diplocarpon coronariae TaxID=2795749 RepID=A0A218YTA1_9HELO|nr:hypothetical protein B2J93_2238 [Marssonina coronariae]